MFPHADVAPQRGAPRERAAAAQTPQREQPRAVASDAARSAASTGFGLSDTEVGSSPGRCPMGAGGAARHATWQAGHAARDAASRLPHAASAGLRPAAQLHLGSPFADDGLAATDGMAAGGGAPLAISSQQSAGRGALHSTAQSVSSSSARSIPVAARLSARAPMLPPQRDAPVQLLQVHLDYLRVHPSLSLHAAQGLSL
jgi:hypothetical protein